MICKVILYFFLTFYFAKAGKRENLKKLGIQAMTSTRDEREISIKEENPAYKLNSKYLHLIQWKPLKGITSGKGKSGPNKRLALLTEVIYVMAV